MSLAPPAQMLKVTVDFHLRLIAVDLQSCFCWLPTIVASSWVAFIVWHVCSRGRSQSSCWPWKAGLLLRNMLICALSLLYCYGCDYYCCCVIVITTQVAWQFPPATWFAMYLIDCLLDWLIDWFLDWPCISCLSAQFIAWFKNSLIRLFIHLHVQPFLHAIIHPCICHFQSFMQSFMHSCNNFCSLIYSLTHFLTVSFSHLVAPMHLFTHPLIHSPIQSVLCSFMRSSMAFTVHMWPPICVAINALPHHCMCTHVRN